MNAFEDVTTGVPSGQVEHRIDEIGATSGKGGDCAHGMKRIKRVLLVPHTGRRTNVAAAARAAELLQQAGVEVRICIGDHRDPKSVERLAEYPVFADMRADWYDHTPEAAAGMDVVLVLGGDGTFLRAADLAFSADLPVFGINLGHVGFLAEWESDSLELAIQRLIAGDYTIEERMTIDVRVFHADDDTVTQGWALNEMSLECADRRGVLDVVVEIDGRPVSAFGCDGVLVSTPTGSTAYAFSAGGPILWPELQAILVVPNNAHAVFAKPLVVSPHSVVAVESATTTFPAMTVLDGFRQIRLSPGSRVEITRGTQSVKWVRLDTCPFADRLVRKLRLPVEGWRGPRK